MIRGESYVLLLSFCTYVCICTCYEKEMAVLLNFNKKQKKRLKLQFEASSSFSNEQYITDERSCYVYGTSDETEVDFSM